MTHQPLKHVSPDMAAAAMLIALGEMGYHRSEKLQSVSPSPAGLMAGRQLSADITLLNEEILRLRKEKAEAASLACNLMIRLAGLNARQPTI